MKVLLCGFHWTGCCALEQLCSEGHEVFVYTHECPYHIPSLIEFCKERKIKFSTEKISVSNLPFSPDLICSIYYRNLIDSQIIELCENKIFNLHGSLLPKYRGCSSLTWAMINGENEVGYTYHYIDNGCDTGKIIRQESLEIFDWDTQETLFMRVMFESMKCFKTVVHLVMSGYSGSSQTGKASFYRRGCPNDGKIDPDWDMEKKRRFVRAMIYPPYPPAKFQNKEVKSLDDLNSLDLQS